MQLVIQWKRWVSGFALAAMVVGCGGEDGPDTPDGGDGSVVEGDGGGNGGSNGGGQEDAAVADGGDEEDAGTTGSDASTTASDDETDGGTTTGGDAGTSGTTDAGEEKDDTPGTLLNLPHDGEVTSICYEADDCNGDDLVCFGAGNEAPGQCTEDCQEDSDCAPVDGLAPTCNNGRCLVGCNGDDDEGDGPCPDDMECRDLTGTGLPIISSLLDPNFWCVYPADGGSNTVAKHGKCDPDHGDGDCEHELACHAPDDARTHGYCTDSCDEDEDCSAPAGVSSTPVCGGGQCELDCSGAGATCPEGMNCINVAVIGDRYRCLYID